MDDTFSYIDDLQLYTEYIVMGHRGSREEREKRDYAEYMSDRKNACAKNIAMFSIKYDNVDDKLPLFMVKRRGVLVTCYSRDGLVNFNTLHYL